MATSEIFNLTEPIMMDDGIKRFEYSEYEPKARTNFNTGGNIVIEVNQDNMFTLPSKAYLLFEGRLLKTDETSYANTDSVTLAHNGIMHLFDQVKYSLSNTDIEPVFHTGKATTMLGMLKYPNDYQLAQGLNRLWVKDSETTASLTDNNGFTIRQAYLVQKPTKKGSFSIIIPLRHIFGFCDNYDKAVYGARASSL